MKSFISQEMRREELPGKLLGWSSRGRRCVPPASFPSNFPVGNQSGRPYLSCPWNRLARPLRLPSS